MLTLDGEAQQRWRRENRAESSQERRLRLLAEDIKSNSVSVSSDAGYDVSDVLGQIGKPMTSAQVIEKLKLCNGKLVFERAPAFPELYGIYVLTMERTPTGTMAEKKTHICGMEAGIMPEFSILHKTYKRVPKKELFGVKKPTREVEWDKVETFASETRGWRTVLIRLLHAHLITRGDVQKHFGWTPSRDSKKWYDATR